MECCVFMELWVNCDIDVANNKPGIVDMYS